MFCAAESLERIARHSRIGSDIRTYSRHEYELPTRQRVIHNRWMSARRPNIRRVTGAKMTVYVAVALASGVAAHLLGASRPWSLIIAVAAPILLAAAPHFLLAAIQGALTPRPSEDAASAMSGMEFEDHVAHIARSCGVPVIMTSVTGDWGVDLVIGRRPERLAVQCKRQSRPVGAGAVQEVVAGAPMHGCTKIMVVTNHDFTPAAIKLAELHACVLVGGAELPRLRSIIRRLTEPSAPTAL
jgi:restriction system protein